MLQVEHRIHMTKLIVKKPPVNFTWSEQNQTVNKFPDLLEEFDLFCPRLR